MNTLDKVYQDLLCYILGHGVKKQTRNGETLSLFGFQIRHDMSEGFPLLTTKKMYWKGIVTELLWFLRGDTNIKYLVDNGCHIWDGDAYKRYVTYWGNPIDPINYKLYGATTTTQCFHPDDRLFTKEEFINKIKTDDEFASKWGELGKIYGRQWRSWDGYHKSFDNETRYIKNINGIDQIANLISELKTNPDSRRLMVNAWNVADLPVTDYRTDDELYEDYLKQNS